ncbi:pseudouridine synthase pus4 [Microbotryomycetes sp. JL201]|nr:pseudouridine synthase pus4 [Microbotryomycetes sp. JL201]
MFASSSLFKDDSKDSQPVGKQKYNKRDKRSKFRHNNRVKMGQGGTLDPLADGVLGKSRAKLIGTHRATKHLAKFLDCTKEYRAIGLLGCSTDSYDSDGKRVRTTAWDHVTADAIREKLAEFRGEIMQTPPVFSALKMDGKKLCDYAREGVPLPRPIAARKQTVHSLELLSFKAGDEHDYDWPAEALDDGAKLELERLEKMVKDGKTVVPSEEEVKADTSVPADEAPQTQTIRPPIFELSMTVSSGTYVRSIIHDLALALGTSAHVVKLTRTRQGQFALDASSASKAQTELKQGETTNLSVPEQSSEKTPDTNTVIPAARECIEWSVFEQALEAFKRSKESEGGQTMETDEEGLSDWERQILRTCEEV